MNELQGITALVTGASKGIGAGIAAALADAGATVAVNYSRDRAGAQAVVDRITAAGGHAGAFPADVSSEADVSRLFADVRAAHGPVRLLVNNAGVWTFQPLTDVTVEQYHRHFDTNVLGNVLASREFARQTEADGGSIINISSVGIGPASPATSLYTATKTAILGLTRVLAVELAPRGIRVNAIAAGLIDTEGTRASGFVGSDAADAVVGAIPLGRLGATDDIAPLATFLASAGAGYITGETIFAAGGLQLV